MPFLTLDLAESGGHRVQMSSPLADEVYTSEEVAQRLKVHIQTVRHLHKTGQLGYVMVGTARRTTPEQLAAYLNARRSDGDT